jgi:tetratricopeptide (TPR) repeat protein
MRRLHSFALSIVLVLCLLPHSVQSGFDPFEIFDEGKEHFRRGEYKEAIEKFSRAHFLLRDDRKNAGIVLLARAQAYYKKGNLRSSGRDVDRVLGSRNIGGDTLALGLQLRGKLRHSKGDYRKALEDFTAAIKTAHEDVALRSITFVDRGMTFMAMDELDKALSDLSMAIKLKPRSAFAYASRALAYLRKDRYDRARRDSERALRLTPEGDSDRLARRVLDEVSAVPKIEEGHGSPSSVIVPVGDHGQIFVRVRFGKQGKPHRFLLDTGAGHSLVSRHLLKEIGKYTKVTRIGKGRVRTADGTIHKVTRYSIKGAYLFDLPLGDIQVVVFDKPTRRVMHLLGMNSLRKVSISIDSSKGQAEIRLTDAKRRH